MKIRHIFLIVAALIICFVLFKKFSSCRGAKDAGMEQEVATVTVVRGPIERKVMFTGNIDAKDAAQVFPRATGKVLKKLLKEGDQVKKGQTIMTINRDEIGYTFKEMPVDSPIDGFVGSVLVDVGQAVDPAQAVAFVVKPGTIRVKLDIPERYMNVILPGTEVSMAVDTLDNETFTGTIVTNSPVVDPKTRTARVEIEVPNPDGRLRHGMFGRMQLVVERRDGVLLLPMDAISWEGANKYVYKVSDGKVHRVEIKPGLRNDHVEILEGLSEGDEVVKGDLLELRDGEKVKVIVPEQENK